MEGVRGAQYAEMCDSHQPYSSSTGEGHFVFKTSVSKDTKIIPFINLFKEFTN